MDRDRAMDIIVAHACCSFTTAENKLCEKCPWNNTNDCEKTAINEIVIIEAMDAFES